MKNAAILIGGVVIGYFVFSLLNPQPTEHFTVKTRTIKQTNTIPIAVQDTRYHAPDAEIAPAVEAPVVNIKVEPVTETKTEVINQHIKSPKIENKTKLNKDRFQFGFKTFAGFNQIPFLAANDSKLIKIRGQYNGSLNFLLTARTGEVSKVNLKITEKETTMTVIDAYDNIDDNYTFGRNTAEVFKTLPEDENLIMLVTNSDSSLIFDLRDLPVLKGKAFVRNVVFGEVELKKKQEKK